MLHAMRRSQFFGSVAKTLWYIIVVIVLPYVAWLYLQPYLDAIMGQYQEVQGKATTIQETITKYQNLLQGLQK